MLTLIGVLIGIYVLTRCLVGATENVDGSVSQIGRFFWLCGFVLAAIVMVIMFRTPMA